MLIRAGATLAVVFAGVGYCTRHRPDPRAEAVMDSSLRSVADLTLDRFHVSYARDGKLYAVEDHDIYVSVDTGRSFSRVVQLPKPPGTSLAAHMRNLVVRHELVRRVRRSHGPRNLVVLGSGTIIVFWDRIYRVAAAGVTIHEYPTAHGPFPYSVGVAVGPDDSIYYGEYKTTPRPNSIAIVRGTDDGRTWDVVHRFAAGEIFHVHGITHDPWRNGYWVAAGDRGREPRLLFTGDGFRTFTMLGCCSQEWRLVDLIVAERFLYWGSDDDENQPGIYRYDFSLARLDTLALLDNPSYHAAVLEDGTMAITTTFEPLSTYTRRASPPAATTLWVSSDGVAWHPTLTIGGSIPGDVSDVRPTMGLPSGDPLPALIVTPFVTERHDFSMLRIRRPVQR